MSWLRTFKAEDRRPTLCTWPSAILQLSDKNHSDKNTKFLSPSRVNYMRGTFGGCCSLDSCTFLLLVGISSLHFVEMHARGLMPLKRRFGGQLRPKPTVPEQCCMHSLSWQLISCTYMHANCT